MPDSPTSEGSQPIPLTGKDAFRLAARQWDPAGEPLGHVGVVHGLGEHSGRYDELARWLSGAGYRVIAFDLRGHGLTAGKRGHVSDYEILLDDIDCLRQLLAANSGHLPQFLFGHSLGGNLILNYALRRRPALTGLVVSSPLLRLTSTPSIWTRTATRMINQLWPSCTINTGVRSDQLSHDPQTVADRDSDPLVHTRVSVRLAVEMVDNGEWVLEHASQLKLPLLLLHGNADRLTSPEATRAFAVNVHSPCELYLSPDGYHELHREVDRQMTFERIIGWLGTCHQDHKS